MIAQLLAQQGIIQ